MLLAEGSFLSQMMLLVGMILLAWILIRRNIMMRKKTRMASQEIRQMERNTQSLGSSTPLADAPKEVLRWQAAMFDLQRDLKAELDTKITVVQSLLRQVDEKVALLESASGRVSANSSIQIPHNSRYRTQIETLSCSGLTAAEIAEKLGVSLAEVELSLSNQPAIHSTSEGS